MFRLGLILFLSWSSLLAYSQSGLVNSSPIVVTKFDGKPSEGLILLPMGFDSKEWLDAAKTNLNDKQVLIISLVYTRFRTSPTFDQVSLNRARLKQVQDLLPNLFSDRTILWRLVEQTDGETRAEAEKLFHGFAFNVRPKPTKESRKAELQELAELKNLLTDPNVSDAKISEIMDSGSSPIDSTRTGDKAYFFMEEGLNRTFDRPAAFIGGNEALHHHLVSNLSYPIEAQIDSIEGTVILSFDVSPDGNLESIKTIATVSPELDAEAVRVMKKSPKWFPALFNGVPIVSSYTIPIVFDLDGDGKAETGKIKTVGSEFLPFGQDKTVTSVLNRNEWDKMAIVCDVTGSMSPYSSQLLAWFRTHSQDPRIHSFTFFNDGDEKNDKRKKIGSTGGIYTPSSNNLDTIFETISLAMNNGNGGDTPENNLEAALMAQSNCPDCDIILISDNFATPRDLGMYEQITNPIRIIPCGAQLGLNLNYLMLAYQTNGSLHTLDSDIIGFDKMHEREIVSVGNDQYQLLNGRFIRLR